MDMFPKNIFKKTVFCVFLLCLHFLPGDLFSQDNLYSSIYTTNTLLNNKISNSNNSFAKPSLSLSRFNIIIGGSFLTTSASNNIKNAFKESGFEGTPSGFYSSWSLGMDYELNDRFKIDLIFNKTPKGNIKITGKDDQQEIAERTSYSILFNFILDPVDSVILNSTEIAIGAGPALNYVKVDYMDFGSATIVSEFVPSLHIQATLDYYIYKNISTQLKIQGRILPAVEAPEVSNLISHKINFSSFEIYFGFRIHL